MGRRGGGRGRRPSVDLSALVGVAAALAVQSCRCGPDGSGRSPADGAVEAAAEAAAEPPSPSPPAEEEEAVVARAMVKVGDAVVRDAPRSDGRPLGVLRWGAELELSEVAGGPVEGWARMRGVGWLKAADLVTRRDGSPKLGFVPVAPELGQPLPYRYARVTAEDGVPVYRRPPKRGEDPRNALLRTFGQGYYFTVDRWVNIYDRQMYRTTRYWFVPREGTATVSGPTFEGIEVTAETALPFLWVTDPTTLLCPTTRHPEPDAGLGGCERAPRHERLPFLERRDAAGVWYRTRGDRFVAATQVAFVDRVSARPREVGPDERWVHVDLRNQVAALYEGDRMVFVTLISSGDDEHPTPTGTFRIESKHVTSTMDNEDNLSGPYFIQDVPWVMFFRGSYALHGAFWHDRFGLRTSHGCVNLSPPDARRFFLFATSPELPDGWHAVYAAPGRPGALVHITG